jgi:hypothetical protein
MNKPVASRGIQGRRQHGTVTVYMGGCRCDACREAGSAYFRARRAFDFDAQDDRVLRIVVEDGPLLPKQVGDKLVRGRSAGRLARMTIGRERLARLRLYWRLRRAGIGRRLALIHAARARDISLRRSSRA